MDKGKHVASRIRTGRAAGHGNTAMRRHRCGSRRRYTRPSRTLVGFAGEEHLKWRGDGRRLFDDRTNVERPATILLPNSVAQHDRGRHVMDDGAKIFKENNIACYWRSLASMAANALRMRCSTS